VEDFFYLDTDMRSEANPGGRLASLLIYRAKKVRTIVLAICRLKDAD
jgi:hypothetical protein